MIPDAPAPKPGRKGPAWTTEAPFPPHLVSTRCQVQQKLRNPSQKPLRYRQNPQPYRMASKELGIISQGKGKNVERSERPGGPSSKLSLAQANLPQPRRQPFGSDTSPPPGQSNASSAHPLNCTSRTIRPTPGQTPRPLRRPFGRNSILQTDLQSGRKHSAGYPDRLQAGRGSRAFASQAV